MKCSVESCENLANRPNGLCRLHYARWYRTGKTTARTDASPLMPREGVCSVEGCGREIRAKRLCTKHLTRYSKYGDPLVSAPPPKPKVINEPRELARQQGLKSYFCVTPCVNGHLCERNVKTNICLECMRERTVIWRKDNPDKRKEQGSRARAKRDKKDVQAAWQHWYSLNKDKRREYRREYQRNRVKEDINYKLAMRLRSRMSVLIKREYRTGSMVRDLGCTVPFLKEYIENKFTNEMTWDNWGDVWELDHIKPLSKFDLTNKEQFLIAAHYINLQPLLYEDNRNKKAKNLHDWLAEKKALGLCFSPNDP